MSPPSRKCWRNYAGYPLHNSGTFSFFFLAGKRKGGFSYEMKLLKGLFSPPLTFPVPPSPPTSFPSLSLNFSVVAAWGGRTLHLCLCQEQWWRWREEGGGREGRKHHWHKEKRERGTLKGEAETFQASLHVFSCTQQHPLSLSINRMGMRMQQKHLYKIKKREHEQKNPVKRRRCSTQKLSGFRRMHAGNARSQSARAIQSFHQCKRDLFILPRNLPAGETFKLAGAGEDEGERGKLEIHFVQILAFFSFLFFFFFFAFGGLFCTKSDFFSLPFPFLCHRHHPS